MQVQHTWGTKTIPDVVHFEGATSHKTNAASLQSMLLMLLSLSVILLVSQAYQQLAKRFDKRALQHDIDTHRLFLLTEYHARLTAGTDSMACISPLQESENG